MGFGPASGEPRTGPRTEKREPVMKILQLSLFLENRPGQLVHPCRVLARSGVNLLTATLADTQQFGILRLIVTEPERARKVLQDAGCVVNMTEVVAVDVADRPGGLAEVLEAIDAAGIGIEYLYALTCHTGERATIIFRFDGPDEAIAALKTKGIRVLGAQDL